MSPGEPLRVVEERCGDVEVRSGRDAVLCIGARTRVVVRFPNGGGWRCQYRGTGALPLVCFSRGSSG